MSDETKLIRKALNDIFEYTGTDKKFADYTDLETIFLRCVDRINELPKGNVVIPEPNGGDKLLAEILEILKDGPQSSFDIYIDVKDVYYGANHVEAALDKLIDDGKVEKIDNKYQLRQTEK